MRDLYLYYLKMEHKSEALKEAMKDPRVMELSNQIAELQQKKENLIKNIADDIYKKKYGS